MDETGKLRITDMSVWNLGQFIGYTAALVAVCYASVPCTDAAETIKSIATPASVLAVSVAGFGIALGYGTDASIEVKASHAIGAPGNGILRPLTGMATSLQASSWLQNGLARAMIFATTTHALMIIGALMLTLEEQ